MNRSFAGPRVWLFLSFFFVTALSHSSESGGFPPQTCPLQLASLVDKAIAGAVNSEPDSGRAKLLEQYLRRSQSKVIERVSASCPQPEACPPAVLVRLVASALDEELRDLEAPNLRIGLRVWMTVLLSVGTYVGLSTVAQHALTSLSATMTVALLTWFGTYGLEALGAPILDYVLPRVRRWMYTGNNLALSRNLDRPGSLQRHRVTYMLQQEIVSEVESDGRSTESEVLPLLMTSSMSACQAYQGDCSVAEDRAAAIFAEIITHLVENYPELDLKAAPYANKIDTHFGRWYLKGTNRTEFVDRVMHYILTEFDVDSHFDPVWERRYRSIVTGWFIRPE